uniref:uncharacterized protein LOC101303893 isoform X3 n=1 Tax=Fragaria vesca subsp. vesca TaxID=101020 RepID=UPI0005CB0CF4|nr:PREDICTED: uncharacterized protein LOC101303893 isoform X3 [Fragaria vesca subsp. vesca]
MASRSGVSHGFQKKPVFENLEGLYLTGLDYAELCAVLFNLKVLHVVFCYNLGNILVPSTLLQRLPNLEELICVFNDRSQYVFGHEEASLVSKKLKLRNIELSGLDTVSMCDGPIPPAMLQNLQSLSIDWCKLQGSLFTYDAAQYLSQLHCLVLEDCPFLNRIVEASNKRIILPKLKQLSLTHLPLLYYDTATFDIECPSLEDLYVQDYPNIPDSSSDFHSSKQEQFRRRNLLPRPSAGGKHVDEFRMARKQGDDSISCDLWLIEVWTTWLFGLDGGIIKDVVVRIRQEGLDSSSSASRIGSCGELPSESSILK